MKIYMKGEEAQNTVLSRTRYMLYNCTHINGTTPWMTNQKTETSCTCGSSHYCEWSAAPRSSMTLIRRTRLLSIMLLIIFIISNKQALFKWLYMYKFAHVANAYWNKPRPLFKYNCFQCFVYFCCSKLQRATLRDVLISCRIKCDPFVWHPSTCRDHPWCRWMYELRHIFGSFEKIW